MRTLAIVASLVSLLSAAMAQQQQQQVFALQIPEADLVVIGRALEAMPYRDAAPVIARLQQQLNAIAEKAKRDEKPATSPE